MSSEIERFGRFGQYLLYSEYERVVASVAARAMEQIDSMNAVHEAEVARLRAMAQEQGVRDGNEIGRLRAELQNAAKAALDATALACEKEREAHALRVNAERYKWLRDQPWRDNEELEPVIRLQLNTLWDDKIDAAMGEGK